MRGYAVRVRSGATVDTEQPPALIGYAVARAHGITISAWAETTIGKGDRRKLLNTLAEVTEAALAEATNGHQRQVIAAAVAAHLITYPAITIATVVVDEPEAPHA